MEKIRTTFLIDGFNLYHSVVDAQKGLSGQSMKWLNLRNFLSSYLQIFGKSYSLEEIYYFTAYAYHFDKFDPHTTTRHKNYVKCLKDSGVKVEVSKFKKKPRKNNYEEKETDVKIAVTLLQLLIHDKCDCVVLITGDTDLAPAIRAAAESFPEKFVYCGFPYNRRNDELDKLVDRSFTMNKKQYPKYQFDDPYIMKDGTKISKPSSW